MSSTIGETPPQQVSLPQSVSNLERKHLERKTGRDHSSPTPRGYELHSVSPLRSLLYRVNYKNKNKNTAARVHSGHL